MEVFFIIKMQSLVWLHGCEGTKSIDEVGWCCRPWDASLKRAPLHTGVNILQQPPLSGEYKFNVDGSDRRKLRSTVCDGVHRDSKSYVLVSSLAHLVLRTSTTKRLW
ncbi:Uncharacterized protein TCM_013993 [Theobroma cacao]|uniref:Uncharacterized protein n=1 Tax=Theobroma cacao TaxID=3641 RepID=A0A061FX55_THECC|nr:Uncharacterized protein TCM_013993 [Theobroma cacao]